MSPNAPVWSLEAVWILPVFGLTVAGLLSIALIAANQFLGVGGFFELLPPDVVVPTFDWKRFAMEPVRVAIVLLIYVAVAAIGILAVSSAR